MSAAAAEEPITQDQVNAIERVLVDIHNAGATYTFVSVAQHARLLHRGLLDNLSEADLVAAVGAIWDRQVEYANARKRAH